MLEAAEPVVTLRLKDVPNKIIDDFLLNSSNISQKSQQQGLQYAVEKYIHDINVYSNKIEAKVYHSQRKREKPHRLVVSYMGNSITGQECSCIAG